jgi:hypothetical protein
MKFIERNKMIRYLQDCVLAFLQRRCQHPGEMVAVDVLEGCVDGLEVAYCRRCGSIKTDWKPAMRSKFASLERPWRLPDPHLWRGY